MILGMMLLWDHGQATLLVHRKRMTLKKVATGNGQFIGVERYHTEIEEVITDDEIADYVNGVKHT